MSFFGFLRVGELAVSSFNSYQAGTHLSLGHAIVKNQEEPSPPWYKLETDPFRKEVLIFIGNRLCPVVAISGYLAILSYSQRPFFPFKDVTM